MSYDIRLGVQIKDTDIIAEIGEPEYDSPTYNLGTMFRECTGWDFKQGEWYPCKIAFLYICDGIYELVNNPWKYKEYEPDNGWGTISVALRTLESVRDYIKSREQDIPLEYLWIKW